MYKNTKKHKKMLSKIDVSKQFGIGNSNISIEMLYEMKYGKRLSWNNLNQFLPMILKYKIKEQKNIIVTTIQKSKIKLKNSKQVKEIITKSPIVKF
jgi:hypothetical protein